MVHHTLDGLVVLSSVGSMKKRKWDKKHFCVFCCKPYSKIAQHLESAHDGEMEVAHALSLKKKSKKRKEIFDRLRGR